MDETTILLTIIKVMLILIIAGSAFVIGWACGEKSGITEINETTQFVINVKEEEIQRMLIEKKYCNCDEDCYFPEKTNYTFERGHISCKGLELQDTSECLRQYVSTFFNYTSNIDSLRSFEDIKNNGGDCYDYTQLYIRFGKDLGYEVMEIKIIATDPNSLSHIFAIMYEPGVGYCLMDQLKEYGCYVFGTSKK